MPEISCRDSPIGTRAPAIGGGHWYRTAAGWKWNGPDGCGDTFPRPGGDWDGRLITPAAAAPEPPVGPEAKGGEIDG
jgi:hypothetical protein